MISSHGSLLKSNKTPDSDVRKVMKNVLANEKLMLLSSHLSMLKTIKTPNSYVPIIMIRI